ncbi:MAG: hypothetical protein A2580_00960 [Hydrogenophilales bacterium RIFOXYD1_FULL_62_11]|nr:MAG: hypothetical protein A2580_00960 [Hydrogenophilales bacterium RIFOXYD1_FULL_62_11]
MTSSEPKLPGKLQTTVLMSEELAKSVDAAYKFKYGNRGLSRWVEDAVEGFVRIRDHLIRVGTGEADTAMDSRKVIRLTPRTQELLNQISKNLKRLDPDVRHPQSMILRASFTAAIRLEKSLRDAPYNQIGVPGQFRKKPVGSGSGGASKKAA